MSCAEAARELCNSSFIHEDVSVLITGGEPFLRDDLLDFVVPILERFTSSTVSITTSGTLPIRIKEFLRHIPKNIASRVAFAVSIDGLESTHNVIRKHNNAYALALESVNTLVENGFVPNVNTVIHSQNLSELDALKSDIAKKIGIDIPITFIPICTDVAKERKFPYTEEELRLIFPYIRQSDFYTKLICSYGKIETTGFCHAGEINIVLLPSQKIYTCVVGASYSSNKSELYCIGELKNGSIDEILENRHTSNALQHAKKCKRCNNPCEVEREHRHFSLSYTLSDNEIERYLELSGETVYFGFGGWHVLEVYDGYSHRWMSERDASVYVCNKERNKNFLYVSVANHYPENMGNPMELTISVNNITVYETNCLALGSHELNIDLEACSVELQDMLKVTFSIDKLWQPSAYSPSSDSRFLGILLNEVK
jgi:MoaA/NifB/PqqE/SkfB family radical SAM enzyme